MICIRLWIVYLLSIPTCTARVFTFCHVFNGALHWMFCPGIGVQIHGLPYQKIRRDDLRHTLFAEKFNRVFDAIKHFGAKFNASGYSAILPGHSIICRLMNHLNFDDILP